jgi:hypothetical protein
VAVFEGVLGKPRGRVWCFRGLFVVECVGKRWFFDGVFFALKNMPQFPTLFLISVGTFNLGQGGWRSAFEADPVGGKVGLSWVLPRLTCKQQDGVPLWRGAFICRKSYFGWLRDARRFFG